MSTFKVYNAFDQKILETVSIASSSGVERVVERAFSAFRDNPAGLPKYERIKILNKLIRLMVSEKDDIIETAVKEGGKPWLDSQIEVDRAIQGVKIAINEIENLSGTQIPMGHTQSSQGRLAFTVAEPKGVVFAISAFNHPINLIVHQVVPAVAAGCPVIIKPAKATPLSCLDFVHMLYQSGLPEKWCQALTCSRQDAEKLVTDKRIAFFTFIGSAKVGWGLRSLLPPGTGCALEHGGAAPVIVEKDADQEKLIPALLKGGYYHAGQVCVSVQRVFIHESMLDEVLDRFVPLVKSLTVGDPLLKTTQVGPLISPREVDRIEQWVNEAADSGGTVLCGGRRISDTLYEPTVILNPDREARVSTQEIFGPVVCFYGYKNREDAINRANSLPFSFQASVFSQDIDAAFSTARRLKAEAVMINDHTAFRVDWMPFGGSGESGLGMGGIGYSIRDMIKEKLLVLNLS